MKAIVTAVIFLSLTIGSIYAIGVAIATLNNQPVAATIPTELPPTSSELPLTRDNLLRLVNEERARTGASPLVIDEMLNTSAQWKAEDMEKFNYFGHVKPGTEGNEALSYLARLDGASGDRCGYIAENLAWRTGGPAHTATGAFNSWVGSEAHYSAMIDPEYTLTGFGITHGIAVQHFCKPL